MLDPPFAMDWGNLTVGQVVVSLTSSYFFSVCLYVFCLSVCLFSFVHLFTHSFNLFIYLTQQKCPKWYSKNVYLFTDSFTHSFIHLFSQRDSYLPMYLFFLTNLLTHAVFISLFTNSVIYLFIYSAPTVLCHDVAVSKSKEIPSVSLNKSHALVFPTENVDDLSNVTHALAFICQKKSRHPRVGQGKDSSVPLAAHGSRGPWPRTRAIAYRPAYRTPRVGRPADVAYQEISYKVASGDDADADTCKRQDGRKEIDMVSGRQRG